MLIHLQLARNQCFLHHSLTELFEDVLLSQYISSTVVAGGCIPAGSHNHAGTEPEQCRTKVLLSRCIQWPLRNTNEGKKNKY